jgi:hypothetical protein
LDGYVRDLTASRGGDVIAAETYPRRERLSSSDSGFPRRDFMAEVNISVPHGQTVEAARVNFETAIGEAQAQHGRWIQRVEWSEDRSSAVLSGPGYRVTVRFDEVNVHVRGQVPLALKLLEGPVRRFVRQTLGNGPASS